MSLALGLLETRGLIAAIEAADAMAKASNVRLIGKEKTNPALITIKVVGEVAAVRASVDAGAAAAARVGEVVSVHIIPKPDEELIRIIPELFESTPPEKRTRQSKKSQPAAPQVPVKEDIPAITEQPAEQEGEQPEISSSEEALHEEVTVDEPFETVNEEIVPTDEMFEAVEPMSQPVIEDTPQPNELSEITYVPLDEGISAPPADESMPEPEPVEDVIQVSVPENLPEDLFSQAERYAEEKMQTPGDTEESDFKSGDAVTEFSLEDGAPELPAQSPPPDIKSADIQSLNVHELRRLARTMENFPIQGREISRASRQELLYYLQNLS